MEYYVLKTNVYGVMQSVECYNYLVEKTKNFTDYSHLEELSIDCACATKDSKFIIDNVLYFVNGDFINTNKNIRVFVLRRS